MNKSQKSFFFVVLCNILIATLWTSNLYGSTIKKDNFSYLTNLEREVVAELNLARSQPKVYAGFLLNYSGMFVGRELREPGEITILTSEGRNAVDEAIRFLRSQKSLSPLLPSKGMSKGAQDMVRMQESTSQVGHVGRDGSTFSSRISRYGSWGGSCAENIDYGYNNARRIVMALIIDDGVRNRGHRKSIFDAGFKRVGVACGRHRSFNYMCVIELAVSYSEGKF